MSGIWNELGFVCHSCYQVPATSNSCSLPPAPQFLPHISSFACETNSFSVICFSFNQLSSLLLPRRWFHLLLSFSHWHMPHVFMSITCLSLSPHPFFFTSTLSSSGLLFPPSSLLMSHQTSPQGVGQLWPTDHEGTFSTLNVWGSDYITWKNTLGVNSHISLVNQHSALCDTEYRLTFLHAWHHDVNLYVLVHPCITCLFPVIFFVTHP